MLLKSIIEFIQFINEFLSKHVIDKLTTLLRRFCKWLMICRWSIGFYIQARRRFHKLSLFKQRLISNLMIGLCLSLFISLGQYLGIHPAFNVGNVDWMMKMFINTDAKQPNTPPFILLEINESTYRKWGEPATTPRDKLLELIRFAVQGQAQIIFVDVDLGYRDSSNCPKFTKEDEQLFEFLDNYDSQYCTNKACPHILLVRTTRPLLTKEGKPLTAQYPEQRTSFLDSAVAKSSHLHWVSVGFILDKGNTLRRWRLWEAACNPKTVIPSTQLLAVALIKEQMAGITKVNEALKPFMPQDCQSHTQALIEQNPQLQNATLTLGQNTILSLTPSPLGSRIIYTISKNGKSHAKTQEGEWILHAKTQEGEWILEAKSAQSILSTPNFIQFAPQLVKDKIVAIGGTYTDSHDIYHTPVGTMSGVLTIINAINSLLQYGELHKPPLWQILSFEVLIIILMSLAFAKFPSFWGMILIGCVTVIMLLPLSFWLFKYSIWLETVIPLIFMQLYRMSQDFERKSL